MKQTRKGDRYKCSGGCRTIYISPPARAVTSCMLCLQSIALGSYDFLHRVCKWDWEGQCMWGPHWHSQKSSFASHFCRSRLRCRALSAHFRTWQGVVQNRNALPLDLRERGATNSSSDTNCRQSVQPSSRMPTSSSSFLVALLLLPFLVVSQEDALACSGEFCTVTGGSPGVAARANSCPATDCDGSGVLEHHLGDQDDVAGSLVCLDGTQTRTEQNAFLRCFEGSVCGGTRTIDAVSFHVRSLTVSNYVVTVNLYKGSLIDCSDEDDVRGLHQTGLVASFSSPVMNSDEDFAVDVPITAALTLEPDESLLVEIDAPSLVNRGGKFVIADSADPNQCSPSYLQNDRCGVTDQPVNVALAQPGAGFPGFPDVSYVISVQTSQFMTSSPKPTPSPEPSASPTISFAPVVTPEPTWAPTAPPPFDIGSCFVSVVAVIYCIIGIFIPSFRL